MDDVAKPNFDIRQERFTLQAYFQNPVFNLFQDFPSFARHIFHSLGTHYHLRTTDLRLENGAGSLGDIFLRVSWPDLAEVRIFLDRIEIEPSYLPFLRFQERDFTNDVLTVVALYNSDVQFRAYSVTQAVHGKLLSQPRHEFLAPLTPAIPEGLGPALGAGVVFYFGAEADRLAASVTVDFSRTVEEGIFIQSVMLYDATRVAAIDLQPRSRSYFESFLHQIGLKR